VYVVATATGYRLAWRRELVGEREKEGAAG